MAVHLINEQAGVLHFGPRDNPRRDKYWAENGLIHIEDTSTNLFETISVREFLERLKGINDMVAEHATAKQIGIDVSRQQRFVESAVELARKAQEQGMPSDTSAVRDRARRRKKSVIMPGTAGQYQL